MTNMFIGRIDMCSRSWLFHFRFMAPDAAAEHVAAMDDETRALYENV